MIILEYVRVSMNSVLRTEKTPITLGEGFRGKTIRSETKVYIPI